MIGRGRVAPNSPSQHDKPPKSFERFVAAIEQEALRDIAHHWNDARGARRMPAWADIDPVKIARHLPYVWSWKYDRGADTFTGRLAGEEINRAFGKSLRGVRMADFFAGWHYEAIFARHRRVVTEPAFAHGKGTVFSHADRHALGERIIMPLAADGVHGDGIIGATVYPLPPTKPLDGALHRVPWGEDVSFFPLD